MKKHHLGLPLIIFAMLLLGASGTYAGKAIEIETGKGILFGTLELPVGSNSCPVMLIISGSGPTDRDGNNPIAGKNNSLKFLAEALALQGIASLRYDKRGVGESAKAGNKEEELQFETYINDAVLWCEHLGRNSLFSHLLITGHSEGSLIGMVACRKTITDGFVSISGTAYPASDLILNQLKGKLPEELYRQSESLVEQLKKGLRTEHVPPELNALFRQSVQPYLISWFKYNPIKELSKLQVPILIVQGTTDIQVPVDNAIRLSKANKTAELAIIKGMNHILKEVSGDLQQQIKSYTDSNLPVAPELVNRIVAFSKKIDKE